MKFHYCMPTSVYFGRNCIKENAAVFKKMGTKAVILTYEFPGGLPNLGLEDTKEALDSVGIPYTVSLDVLPDPPVSSIHKIYLQAKDFGADFVVAIGGGSSMDTGKCVALLINNPAEDPLDILFSKVPLDAAPLVTVSTTAGTGAEVTPWAAITRDDINYKGGISSPVNPAYAFADPRYTDACPLGVTRATALDNLCHLIETNLNKFNSPVCTGHTMVALTYFAKAKDALLKGELTEEDRDNLMCSSTVGGMTMTETGCTIPHAMSYPITLSKHTPHGPSCAVTLAAYLDGFKDKSKINYMLSLAGFESISELKDYIDTCLNKKMFGEVTEADIDQWTEDISKETARFAVNPEPMTKEDVRRIYRRSFGYEA